MKLITKEDGTIINLVGKMKINKKIAFFLFLLLFFSCKKEKNVDILELLKLSNYKITKTRVNDSIIKINGYSKGYTLEGNINTNNNSREAWWVIKNKLIGEKYEIEYLFLDKQIQNQIKIYKKNQLYKPASKFYTKSFKNNGFYFKFFFPTSNFKTRYVNFNYSISDTIKRKIIKEDKIDCIKKDNYYSCFIPIHQNEAIIGVVTNFSNFKEKDSDTCC